VTDRGENHTIFVIIQRRKIIWIKSFQATLKYTDLNNPKVRTETIKIRLFCKYCLDKTTDPF
jgi:hypothetical protein